MRKFVVFIIVAGLAGGALVAGGFAWVLYTGPRMKEQPHLRAYQAFVPALPAGVVPAKARTTLEESAGGLEQSAAVSQANLDNGKAFYTYYCIFCHGEYGDGRGPVGESWDPSPSDLRSDRVRRMNRPQLLRSMLTGFGHEPVLEMVVHPQYRRDLVLYVTALSQGGTRRSSP